MTLPRFVSQPGTSPADRIVAAEGRGRAFDMRLEPGPSLVEAIAAGFAREGFSSGTAEAGAMALAPFAYVMPALATTTRHAAYYSETFRPSGITRLDGGALTFGPRDGRPFFHFHALWREADGRRGGGHVLPDDTGLAEPCTVRAFGIAGGGFQSVEDPETLFRLFEPRPAPPPADRMDVRAFALRVRPNEDLSGTLEAFCAAHGIRRSRLRGGVGSTIGARFADGRTVENFATEVFVREGVVEPGPDGRPAATIEVGLVDFTGRIDAGMLRRGENPVLMTFEIAVEEMPH